MAGRLYWNLEGRGYALYRQEWNNETVLEELAVAKRFFFEMTDKERAEEKMKNKSPFTFKGDASKYDRETRWVVKWPNSDEAWETDHCITRRWLSLSPWMLIPLRRIEE